jgi:hypothetical protein
MRSKRTEPPSLPPHTPAASAPEVWGGVEYTCNRVRDRFFDQMELSGHCSRPEDLEKIAGLGIRRLRCGLLWERHEREPSWRWTDQRVQRMQELGIDPIAGFLHHGSGPPHTSLVDPDLPTKLAAYARAVAERYPSIQTYTPVNEPHTTARFSAMYGVWYPHHMDRRSYVRALLLQVKATVLSMEQIRQVRPDAKLVQTDDLGCIRGTSPMRDVVAFMNERRWLPFDLLCGSIDRHHALFEYLRRAGIPESEILWFCDHP